VPDGTVGPAPRDSVAAFAVQDTDAIVIVGVMIWKSGVVASRTARPNALAESAELLLSNTHVETLAGPLNPLSEITDSRSTRFVSSSKKLFEAPVTSEVHCAASPLPRKFPGV